MAMEFEEESWNEIDRNNSAQIDPDQTLILQDAPRARRGYSLPDNIHLSENDIDEMLHRLDHGINLWRCEESDSNSQYVRRKAVVLRKIETKLILAESISMLAPEKIQIELEISSLSSVQEESISLSSWWGIDCQFNCIALYCPDYGSVLLQCQTPQEHEKLFKFLSYMLWHYLPSP